MKTDSNKFQNLFSQSLASILSKKHILNQAIIMSGTIILGMVFGAAGSIWAARCLGPHNLGISGMVQNIVGLAMLPMEMIFPTVLVREYKNAHDSKTRDRIVQASHGFWLLIALGFCLIATFFMALKWVPSEYHFASWFFLPLILLNSMQPGWIFQSEEKQHFQSAIEVIQPALAAVIYLIWFKPGMSAGDDLLVNSIAALVLTIVFWRAIYKLTTFKGPFFRFDLFKDIKVLILNSRWLFVSALAVYVYTTFEQPLLGWLYSVEELGKYRTAISVTNAAQAFFTIIPAILYPRFIEWRKQHEEILWERQLKLTAFFSAGGFITALCGFIFIPFFYPYVFGHSFAQAAWPCAILVLSKIIAILNGIYGWGLMTDHSYDKFVSMTMIGTAIFSLGMNLLFIPKFGMMGAAIINLLSEILILLLFFGLSFRRIQLIRNK